MVAEMLRHADGQFRPLFIANQRHPAHAAKDCRQDPRLTFVPRLPQHRQLATAGPSCIASAPDCDCAPDSDLTGERETLLAEAREQAAQMIQEAQTQAQQLLTEAKTEQARLAEKTQEQTAAVVRAEQEAAFAREIERFRSGFRDAQETALEMIAQEVMSVVVDIAEKVIHQAVEIDPEATLRAVREALPDAPGGAMIRVLVPEEDAAQVSEQRTALLGVLQGVADIQIVPEARLTRGGCIVQSDRGEVDAQLQTRMARVREEIERAMP